MLGKLVREWLDNGVDFEIPLLDSMEEGKGIHSVAEQLILFLGLLDGGVIPAEAHSTVMKGKSGVPVVCFHNQLGAASRTNAI